MRERRHAGRRRFGRGSFLFLSTFLSIAALAQNLDSQAGTQRSIPQHSLQGLQVRPRTSNIYNAIYIDGVQYPCSGSGIISAINDAMNALVGTVDARICANLTTTTEIDIGNRQGYPLTLLVPDFGTWTISFNNPGQCGLKVFTHSSIVGTAPAGSAGFSLLPAAGASIRSALCTDPDPLWGGSYVNISGVSAGNPNHASIARALIEIDHLFDSSVTDRLMAYNFYGIGIDFNDFCCGATFKNTVSDGYGNSGALPVMVGGGTTSGGTIFDGAFYGLSAVHQGAGQNALQLNYNSSSATFNSVQFHQLWLEWRAGGDTTTPFVSLIGTLGATFDGVGVNSAPSGTNYVFDIQNVGTVNSVLIHDVVQPVGTGYMVKNEITGLNLSGVNWLTSYEYMGPTTGECYVASGLERATCTGPFAAGALLSSSYLTMTPATVDSLPAADGGNAGELRIVSDSTAIVTEGQTCVGGNTSPSNRVMAFSNGTVWKCF